MRKEYNISESEKKIKEKRNQKQDASEKVERQAKDYSSQIKKCNFHKNSVF